MSDSRRVTKLRRRPVFVTEFRCAVCAELSEARRPDARYCSRACRQAAYRNRVAERAAHARIVEEGPLGVDHA